MPKWQENNGYGSTGQPVKHWPKLRELHETMENMKHGDNGGIKCELMHVPRDQNRNADGLAKQALNESQTRTSDD